MEINALYTSIHELHGKWELLQSNRKKTGKIAIDEFKEVFSATYALLDELAHQAEIPKGYMPLILTIADFTKAANSYEDYVSCAAAILTERMLHNCVISTVPESMPTSQATIYSLKERKDTFISFNDVESAIGDLAALIETNEE